MAKNKIICDSSWENHVLIPLAELKAGPIHSDSRRRKVIEALGIDCVSLAWTLPGAYSSDSGRAIQTMGIILDQLGLKRKFLISLDKPDSRVVFPEALMEPRW